MHYQGRVEKGMVVMNQPLPLPDGTPVVVEPVVSSDAEFWYSASLEELVLREGVATPKSPEELLGGWPADDLNDGFEQVLAEWRERDR